MIGPPAKPETLVLRLLYYVVRSTMTPCRLAVVEGQDRQVIPGC
jgi:hypothetical protein